MENPWFFVVNPAGGNGSVARHWPAIRQKLEEAGIPFAFAQTLRRGHATALAGEAVQSGYRRIVAVGGDGTNNETINGLMRQDSVPLSDLLYTLLPVGTGNDWARYHNIPHRLPDWLAFLQSGRKIQHDVGMVQYQWEGQTRTRFFINVAGMAYDAFVVRHLELHGGKRKNPLTYYFAVVGCLFRFSPLPATLAWEGDRRQSEFYTINAGICKYSGGGMQFVPHARPDSGSLAVTMAKRLSKLGVLRATPYFYNGKIDQHPKVEILHTQTFTVAHPEGGEPLLLETDGEFCGQTPVVFSVKPAALPVWAP